MKTWKITYIPGIPYPFIFSKIPHAFRTKRLFTILVIGRAVDIPYPVFIESRTPESFLFIKDYDDLLEKWEQTFYAK